MRTLGSVFIVGTGFLLCLGSPARAQFGDMGEAAKKGAEEAVKEKVKGAAEEAGLSAPEASAAQPGEAKGAESAPTGEPKQAAPVDVPAGAPGTDTGAPEAPYGD